MRRARGGRWPLVVLGAVAVLAWLALRRIDAVEVRGSSMAPGLLPGDRLVALRLPRRPRVGEIVLAPDPRAPGRELVKRVAAIDAGGIALRGDNRTATTDSATFGPVSPRAISWRVVARYWPPDRIGPV
jgi:nickel-type superoxide dismutase maturation protease